MLKKAILGTPKAFKVSIGSQAHCTASVEKSLYAPGELVTVTIAYNVGHNNAVVGTSTGTPVKKVSDTKYTFLMPNNDVVITASASVMSFKISVNKNDGGNVSVKSVANYGETVTVTLSPAEGYSVGNVSASGVGLSGSGNTRTFSMPAGNVVLNVSFKLEYHVIMTVGKWTNDATIGSSKHFGYSGTGVGSLSRIPYFTNPSCKAIQIESYTTRGHPRGTRLYLQSASSIQNISINGINLTSSDNKNYSSNNDTLIFLNLEGQRVNLIFNPPPTGYL